jgi:BASS family bile acid:Na+ symporter
MTISGEISLALEASAALTAFAAGLVVRSHDATHFLRHPPHFARSFVSMNVALPFCVLWFADVFGLDPSVELALAVLAMSPLPAAIPFALRSVDVAGGYGARLIAAESVIAIASIPLTIALGALLLGAPFDVPIVTCAWVVGTRVTLPLLIGVAVARRLPRVAASVVGPVAEFGVILLVAALIPDLFVMWPGVREITEDGTVIAIVALAVIGAFLGFVLGGPSRTDRAVLSTATTWRHPGVALAITSVGHPITTGAGAALLLSVVVGAVVVRPFAWRRIQTRAQAMRAG